MADGFCRDCQSYTPLVYDHTSGYTICSECGLILNSHSIDESDKSDNNYDLARVGGPSSPLLPSRGLGSTVIASPNNNKGSSSSSHGSLTNQLQNRYCLDPNSPLVRALRMIDDMAKNLGLADKIKNYAKELYRKADNDKICGRQRNPRAIVAACLYLACQEEGFPRTFKEIYHVAEGARIKEIHKCIEILKKQLEVGTGAIHAKDIARRYCSNLGLNHHTIRAVQEAVQKSELYDIRRNSTSILAAAIFMVTQLSENKMSLREVAQASEVADGTLKKAYKDLYPYASVLIPSWYANANDIKRLCVL